MPHSPDTIAHARATTDSPDTIARARKDYAEGVKTVLAICREHGMSQNKLYYWVDGARGDGEVAPLPRRRDGFARPRARLRFGGSRLALVRRMWRTADAQVREIETRILCAAQAPEERERDARVLALLVKTLRELTALDQRERADTATDATPDDDGPRDMDEFRRELARRMEAFVDARTAGGVFGAGEAER
ncbi:MAG TPA: transposase [Xanthobacteraceae bacterium]